MLPLFFPVTYYCLLPAWSNFQGSAAYQPLATEDAEGSGEGGASPERRASSGSIEDVVIKRPKVYLSPQDKLNLLKPLVLPYMLPLCFVYVEEYIINSVGE